MFSIVKKDPVVLIVGTRPEAIKIIPVYQALKHYQVPVILCATSQHKDILKQVFNLFGIEPDIDMDIMKERQDLFHITTQVMLECKALFTDISPSCVVVQGDTTSAYAAALAAFYVHIPVAHIEAGLRTSSIKEPFPEEFNRRSISLLSSLHFTPTSLATANLLAEGIKRETIVQSGNTVVDALMFMLNSIKQERICITESIKALVEGAQRAHKKIVLFTFHRREALEDKSITEVFRAMRDIARDNDNVIIVYPAHPNPMVHSYISSLGLSSVSNINILPPLSYQDMVYVLHHSYCVATDSGGLSEEAVSLGKKVFILRTETERMEGVWIGIAELIGTRYSVIVEAITLYLNEALSSESQVTAFGDGQAGKYIAQVLARYHKEHTYKKGAPKLTL